jgi:hypothetical protein
MDRYGSQPEDTPAWQPGLDPQNTQIRFIRNDRSIPSGMCDWLHPERHALHYFFEPVNTVVVPKPT